MPKYEVRMARTTWLTAHVEAPDADAALEEAYEVVPPFTAQEGGWGSFGGWSADADEWRPIDEFYSDWTGQVYDDSSGPAIEQVEEVSDDE